MRTSPLSPGRCSSWAVALGLVVSCAASLDAADHRDSPALLNSAVVGQRDINDIYIFQGTVPNTTVMIMTVNPFAGVMSPTIFDPNIRYEFLIDTDGDALANLVYQVTFDSNPRRPEDQRVQVRLLDLNTPAGSRGIGILRGVGRASRSFRIGQGGRGQVGLFDDPFFFDSAGFQNGLQFTGDDAFAGFNVSAIILELPNADVTRGNSNIAVWARTVDGAMNQADRSGRPAINTVLIPSGQKDAFNAGTPVNDPASFGSTVVNTLVNPPFSRTTADAMALSGILLPDVNTFDVTSSSGFLNGRRLGDDVIDAELDLLTAGAVTGDGVDANDKAFPPGFPYLAPAHP